MKSVVREKFQVSMFNVQFTMDLVARSCSCRWWTLTSNNNFNSYFIMFETYGKSNKFILIFHRYSLCERMCNNLLYEERSS